LFHAARRGHEPVVVLLLKAGANCNDEDYFGHTPRYYAEKERHTKVEI